MAKINAKSLQILRTIDKVDKIGIIGVVDLLQKPIDKFGADLDPIQAGLIGQFLQSNAETNEDTINNMASWFPHAHRVRSRTDLMVLLDKGNSPTLWDKLIQYPQNADDTWSATARPANIAFALDDIVAAIQGRLFAPSSKCSFESISSFLRS